MNFRLLLSTAIFGLIMVLSMGNKNGRASSANRGNTGAPGDETSLGLPKTCMNCHNQGPITASVAITLLDAGNQAVTQYQPGQQYTASVKITATGTGLQGYGFQMIALRDSGNIDLDGFTDTNPNNYKIASISNGRTYAEHDNISATNTFNVKWTAPPAGAGSVTFYAAGNGVNSNGTTSGDGSGFFALKIDEFGSVPVVEPNKAAPILKVSPNPMAGNTTLNTGTLPEGNHRLRAFDSTGKMVWESVVLLGASGVGINIPSEDWHAGVYYLELDGAEIRSIVKVVKL